MDILKDLQILLKLIEKNDQSGELISNNDCLVILGNTGVGKSVTVNYIYGNKLKKERIEMFNEKTQTKYKQKVIKLIDENQSVS